MISAGQARGPCPVRFGRSCWQNTPCSVNDSIVRICCCWCAGNTSTIRLIVCTDVRGVQRGERQVAGLGERQRRLDRLEVAHLADQHDVGVLAQHGAQRLAEAPVRVAADLALVDEAVPCCGAGTRSGPRS